MLQKTPLVKDQKPKPKRTGKKYFLICRLLYKLLKHMRTESANRAMRAPAALIPKPLALIPASTFCDGVQCTQNITDKPPQHFTNTASAGLQVSTNGAVHIIQNPRHITIKIQTGGH